MMMQGSGTGRDRGTGGRTGPVSGSMPDASNEPPQRERKEKDGPPGMTPVLVKWDGA